MRDEIARDFQDSPIEFRSEVRELVGKCLWEVFSENHQVVAGDGRAVDLGSFRYAGGVLADYLNARTGTSEYDYMSFYLGTVWLGGRADLTPVYRMIFRRLNACGFDWIYHFPRLYLFDFKPLKRWALEEKTGPDWQNYDPSSEFATEQEESERQCELDEMRASLAESHDEAVLEARKNPPPTIVAAYYDIYGRHPRGWPPTNHEG